MILLVLACLMGTPAFTPAYAHAFLERATPAVGSAVASAPKSLMLTYTEEVEPMFCHVAVTNAAGAAVTGGAPVARDGGRTLVVPLKPLKPGTYTVDWHVVSVDTHKTEGHFTFTVSP
ncbi:MAG TPA: copper homeostasis periplasmic binding protein CopC [Rhodopila sp.]|uniref:copper homeostasis periplasmic binding protein CopC n=1 Tax=Rhodopila sp. TaxID=2480087 RepID=UPI002CCD34C3|nr:copper homeostasis periplasmic binding protein CopC [Rhodopila sp.]HVY15530.1 copper homeostasis periplasmic binding protein CopC [Rhodopila sp.]